MLFVWKFATVMQVTANVELLAIPPGQDNEQSKDATKSNPEVPGQDSLNSATNGSSQGIRILLLIRYRTLCP